MITVVAPLTETDVKRLRLPEFAYATRILYTRDGVDRSFRPGYQSMYARESDARYRAGAGGKLFRAHLVWEEVT